MCFGGLAIDRQCLLSSFFRLWHCGLRREKAVTIGAREYIGICQAGIGCCVVWVDCDCLTEKLDAPLNRFCAPPGPIRATFGIEFSRVRFYVLRNVSGLARLIGSLGTRR